MTAKTSLLTSIQDSHFPKNSSEGAAVFLAQSEWLLEPRRQKACRAGKEMETVPFHGRSSATTNNYRFVSDPADLSANAIPCPPNLFQFLL